MALSTRSGQLSGRPAMAEVAAVEGADEHAGERVEVGGLREVAGRQCLPEQCPSRLDQAGLEQLEQLGVTFLFGQQ